MDEDWPLAFKARRLGQRHGGPGLVGRRPWVAWSVMAGANGQGRVSAGSVVDQWVKGRAKVVERWSK